MFARGRIDDITDRDVMSSRHSDANPRRCGAADVRQDQCARLQWQRLGGRVRRAVDCGLEGESVGDGLVGAS